MRAQALLALRWALRNEKLLDGCFLKPWKLRVWNSKLLGFEQQPEAVRRDVATSAFKVAVTGILDLLLVRNDNSLRLPNHALVSRFFTAQESDPGFEHPCIEKSLSKSKT